MKNNVTKRHIVKLNGYPILDRLYSGHTEDDDESTSLTILDHVEETCRNVLHAYMLKQYSQRPADLTRNSFRVEYISEVETPNLFYQYNLYTSDDLTRKDLESIRRLMDRQENLKTLFDQ